MTQPNIVNTLMANYLFSLLLVIFFISSAHANTYKNGMVVTEQALATEVGLSVLKSGGNAIDAAVAVGYALAVVHPCCGNIGGGGFMTLHLANGENIFLNFRERAPLAAYRNLFLDKKNFSTSKNSTVGYLSVATPGTVLGLETLLKKYGTRQLHPLIQPAIKLAEEGFILTPGDVKILQMDTSYFQQQPNVAAIFLKQYQPYQPNDLLVQKDLAATLKLLDKEGSKAFYQGSIAKKIVAASKENGGILTLKDFKDYTVKILPPIQCQYREYTIISSPPPSSGGVTLCEMLNIIELYPLGKMSYRSPESVSYIIEAMRLAFADRNNKLGDPDFVMNPIEHLTSKTYAASLHKKIIHHSMRNTPTPVSNEGSDTTHYSIIDKWGNAVAVTYTINNFFGARVIAGDTGFFLNDEMDDFAVWPNHKNQFGLVQGEKNNIQPGKRPLSSMSPTIVLKNNKVVMVLGSPGGPRIITSVLLTLINVLDYHLPLQQAVDQARFHYQGQPDHIDIESGALSVGTKNLLMNKNYRFNPHVDWGAVEAIYIDPNTGLISGANDKRRPAGAALGY